MVRPAREAEKAAWAARETARLTTSYVDRQPVEEEPSAAALADFRALLAAARADGVPEYRYVWEAVVESFDAFELAQPEVVKTRIPAVERASAEHLRKKIA